MSEAMYSIWLMPDPVGLKPLQEEHEAHARNFGAPRFDLHLTLLGGRPLDSDGLRQILPEIARGVAPFSALITDVRGSDLYFQSFYALFEAKGQLLELKRRAMRLAVGEDIGQFMPHVSLLYGPVDAKAKALAIDDARRRLIGRNLRFRSIAIALSSDTIPVDAWRIEREVVLE